MSDWEQSIIDRFESRYKSLEKPVAILLGRDYDRYWIAGSSLLASKPNDFDVYSEHGFDFDKIEKRCNEYCKVLYKTKNALSVDINGMTVQFCNYKQPSLMALIESFDFAHVQIGLEVCIDWDNNGLNSYAGSKYRNLTWTVAWFEAMLTQSTRYDYSNYPLSSLLRINKYKERGLYANKSYKADILLILANIIDRGFKDYDDFKDQLAAVDLMLLEPEETAAASMLYDTCCRKGLVGGSE